MLLEDASSSSLSSVDFGRGAEQVPQARGLPLPPPTEFIQAPVSILDTEAALLDAAKERESLLWRAQVRARSLAARVQAIAERWAASGARGWARGQDEARRLWGEARRLWNVWSPKIEASVNAWRTKMKLKRSELIFDLADVDQSDTAKAVVPTPKARKTSQWDITTQIVDMTRRKSVTGNKNQQRVIEVSDLTLPEGTPTPRT